MKPFIDHTYRTLSGREHTAIAGSSLGGLASLAIAWQHRSVFGMCGALSPSLWWCEEQIFAEFERDPAWPSGTRFWVDMGTHENGGPEQSAAGVHRTQRLIRCLDRAGLTRDRDYRYLEVEGGHHNEAAWAARFDRVLLFFFGRDPARFGAA